MQRLNGKIERSHKSNQQELGQLLSYKDDIGLEARLAKWERFYNFAKPPGAAIRMASYEALGEQP